MSDESLVWDGATAVSLAWKRDLPPVPVPGVAAGESVIWPGTASTGLTWRSRLDWSNYGVQQREGYEMIQASYPVRANTPQLMSHTFRDQRGVVIDLTNYTGVSLLVKFQGAVYATTPAAFSDKPGGVVQATYTYPSPSFGVWDAQFVCTDASNNKLYGEPIQFRVVPNVDDLALNDLPNY